MWPIPSSLYLVLNILVVGMLIVRMFIVQVMVHSCVDMVYPLCTWFVYPIVLSLETSSLEIRSLVIHGPHMFVICYFSKP